MKIKLEYNRDKDVWCLLNKGKSSNNSPFPTRVYKELVASVGDNPNEKNTSEFIDQYIEKNNYNIPKYIEDCDNEYKTFFEQYTKIAERIFGVSIEKDITVYITVNNRCPYSVVENWFFVSISKESPRMTMMHELWHFYTWYKFGSYEEKIGKQKYNDIKEALTALLNVECKDLMLDDKQNNGYEQHKELREQILQIWSEDKNIDNLWNKIIEK